MINLETIPEDRQKDVLSCYWQMLRECESLAEHNKSACLKRDVEGYYRLWNDITGQTHKPSWSK